MAIDVITSNTAKQNQIGDLRIDATIEEVHERNAEITDHAVEGGSFIQDHIVNAPKRLNMTCMITDTPFGRESGQFAQDAFETLEKIYDSRTLITIVSGFKVYSNMAIETLTMPKLREGALRFTVALKQITLTNLQLISSARLARPRRDAQKQDAGKKPTKPVTGKKETDIKAKVAEVKRSSLSSIFGN